MAGELPDDALDDIMIAANVGNEEPNRAMPGGMPGQHEVMIAEFTSDEEDENINNGAPARAPAPAPEREVAEGEDEESDGEEEDSEDEYVSVSSSKNGYRHCADCFYISQCQYASSEIS